MKIIQRPWIFDEIFNIYFPKKRDDGKKLKIQGQVRSYRLVHDTD